MYKIVGADQKEYGPVTEEQLREWIAEGRANGQTLIRFGEGPWKPLATFPEFAAALGTLPPPPSSAAQASPLPPAPAPLPLSSSSSMGPPATNGMAIAGLVCGILGLFCCGPILATVALVLSLIALSQISQNPARYSGRGLAIAGIVLALAGYLFFAILLSTGILRRSFRNFHRTF